MMAKTADLSRQTAEGGSGAPIPGPRSLPLLGSRGNLLPLLRDPINYMLHLYKTYGDVVSLGQGEEHFVFIFSPEHNRILLTDPGLFYNGEVNSPGSVVRIPEGSSARRLFSPPRFV